MTQFGSSAASQSWVANLDNDFKVPAVELERHDSGVSILRSTTPLEAYPRALTERLIHWAEQAPDRIFLAQRADPALDHSGAWQTLSYGEALASVQRIAQALLDRGLGPDRPLMILSGHSLRFALIQLAAMHVGVPVCPVSPSYALASADLARLKQIAELIAPGLVYVEDGTQFQRGLAALAGYGAEVVVGQNPAPGQRTTAFDQLLEGAPTGDTARAFEAITPDTVAKILFTSGSTGAPKGVINTHRMICSNQQALRQLWPFLEREAPVMVEWLPWHHTFAGNVTFNLALCNGGTIYLDEGMPTPQLIAPTLRNLCEISPTIYFNVPAGFQALLPHLEQDARLRASFFRRLRLLYYAAASLPQDAWDRLERLARAETGHAIPFICGWGSTETAPMSTQTPRPARFAGAIGVPPPGTEIKLSPKDDKFEALVRGPNVTPGYWKQPELSKDCFDQDGFYRMGDAVRLADPNDPAQGLIFDGRTAENFKLVSGTFVHVGELRLALLEACAPLLQDVIVTGHDRSEIGLLLLLSAAGCRRICDFSPDATLAEIAARHDVIDGLRAGIADYNRENSASSKRIARAIALTTPLSSDDGELTDKGAVSQRGVLRSRAALVERLYSNDAAVIRFGS
jgi:feruloyl-CoA synthase